MLQCPARAARIAVAGEGFFATLSYRLQSRQLGFNAGKERLPRFGRKAIEIRRECRGGDRRFLRLLSRQRRGHVP